MQAFSGILTTETDEFSIQVDGFIGQPDPRTNSRLGRFGVPSEIARRIHGADNFAVDVAGGRKYRITVKQVHHQDGRLVASFETRGKPLN